LTIGSISGAIYTADSNDGQNIIISKRQSNLTFVWAVELINSQIKRYSLITSNDENYLYAIDSENFKIYKISTTDGSVIKSWTDNTFSTDNDSLFLFISNDDSTLYFNAYDDNDEVAAFWSFNLSGNEYEYHKFFEMKKLELAINLNFDTFIVAARGKSNRSFKIMKFSFNSVTPVWNKEISCPGNHWDVETSAAILSDDRTNLFIAGSFGDDDDEENLLFFTIQENNGDAVSLIYKSNMSCRAYDLILVNQIIYGIIRWSSSFFVMKYESENNSFGVFYLATGSLNRIQSSLNGGIIGFGKLSNDWWIPKFYYEQNIIHPDFEEDTEGLEMIATQIYDYINANDLLDTLTTYTFITDNSPTFSSVNYVEGSNYTDSIVYNTFPETIEINEWITFEISLTVTCSTADEIVVHNLSPVNGKILPKWVSIDSSSGVISGISPNVIGDIYFQMIVISSSAAFTGTIEKIITIKVIPTKESKYSKIAMTSTIVMNLLGISAGVGIFAISGSSPTGIWAIINQIQLLLLIVTIDDHIPSDIEYYLRGNILAMFDLSFIPLMDIPYFNYLAKWLDDEQENRVAKKLKFDSRSTFTNYFASFVVLIGFINMTIVLKLVKNWTSELTSEAMGKTINAAYYLLVNVAIIRLLLEIYLGVLVSGFAELGQASNASASTIVSLNISILSIVGCLALLWISLYLWYKYRSKPIPEIFLFVELFHGLKNSKFAKLNSSIFLLRRLILPLLIVFSFMPRNALYPMLLIIQFAYFVQLVVVKPYEDLGNTIVEIITEAFILISIWIFYSLNTRDKWSNSWTSMYLTLIILNSFIIMAALLGKSSNDNIGNLIIKAIKKLKEKSSRKCPKITPTRESTKIKVESPRPFLCSEDTASKQSIEPTQTLFSPRLLILQPTPRL
jgi:hypothetical protein